jgi:transcriptional regulator GlxA family with amidase domain
VLDGIRYVRDGNVVSAAGVSAGIDMSLWLVGQLWEPAFARQVQRYIQYEPAPPYAAET